ncbi:DUF982 domain-containing protein [Labrys sp. KNU-23]|uniref:DUF982 domain-containing protein n=1 Tax=Labrys sp. KNU-23 TaxID=2789216 RepID=UPI0011EDFF93|nr:DUF982 domain-containing protein [Labrys sp. KNU-23]QEN84832.1 DUF982 domain-containing protein [Labrys sp. KNU-23]
MSEVAFHHAISFNLAHRRIVVIRSVQQVLDFRDNRWSEVGEDLYRAARSACLDALDDA